MCSSEETACEFPRLGLVGLTASRPAGIVLLPMHFSWVGMFVKHVKLLYGNHKVTYLNDSGFHISRSFKFSTTRKGTGKIYISI